MKLSSQQIGSVILGVNDGLIELTGALVGFTFALRSHELVALTGLITGVAAALSMAASAFMQARHETDRSAPKAAFLTGAFYLLVVAVLVAPYFLVANVFSALGWMLFVALVIVGVAAYFNALYLKTSFAREFGITFVFSLGVATISFAIGQLLNYWVGRGAS